MKANHPAEQLARSEVHELVDALDRLYARYLKIYPQAEGNAEIRHHRATLFGRVVEQCVLVDRVLAGRLFMRVANEDWRYARRLAPKIALMFAAGQTPVRIWRERRLRRSKQLKSASEVLTSGRHSNS